MNAKVIGENVTFYRKLRGLTQTTLGEKAYMTQQNVGRIEKGELPDNLPKPLLEVIDRMMKLYDEEKDLEWEMARDEMEITVKDYYYGGRMSKEDALTVFRKFGNMG
ncbi:MAG: helix-turn-helix transcriptional regulator [Selenomonas sp.]|nr:helix-turn-helix transcriptional regulator [Selenomonas sp.]